MSLQLVALVFLIISFIFGVINNELRSAQLWALWAIAVAVALGGAHFSI